MTDTNDKLRSLFLTALMVTSVVAVGVSFTGAAAADVANDTGTYGTISAATDATPVDGEAGSTDSHSFAIAGIYLEDGETETITIDTSDAADAGLEISGTDSVEIIGAGEGLFKSDVTVEEADDEEVVLSVSVDGGVKGGYFVPQIKYDNVDNAESDASATHEVTATGDADDTPYTAEVDYRILQDVRSDAIFKSGNTYDQTVFHGETVRFEHSADTQSTQYDNVQIEIFEYDSDDTRGTRVKSLNTGTLADAIDFDTSQLDTGQKYVVAINEDSDGVTNEVNPLRVTELGLSANATDTSITTEDEFEADVSADAPNEEFTYRLLNSDGDVVELANGDDAEFTETYDGSGAAEISFNPAADEDLGTGNYTIEVEDTSTGITAQTDTIEVTEAGDEEATFAGNGFVTEEVGDVARIPVELSNTDEATLVIGSEDQNYIANVHVEDGDDDGEVTVLFNSYAAGADQSDQYNIVEAEADDDEASLQTQTGDFRENYPTANYDPYTGTKAPSGNLLAVADYDMNVTAGTYSLSDDDEYTDPDAVGGLSLQERSTDQVSLWISPDGDDYSDLETEDINVRIGSNLTQTDEVAEGDYAVHAIEATGIEGALEVARGSDDVRSLLYDNADYQVHFKIEQADPGPNADADRINLHEGNSYLVSDPENDTYYVAVDMEELEYVDANKWGGNSEPTGDVTDGDELTANFTVRGQSVLSDDDSEMVYADYETVERDATLNDGDDVTVRAQSGQQISGETSVAPGSEVTVRIRSTDTDEPFQLTPETEVDEDGTFTVGGDFSDVNPGTNFTAQTRVNGDETGDSVDGVVREAEGADVTFSDQESDGSTVTVDSANLGTGGFIAVHAGDASGDIVGVSDYLESGSQQDVEISLDEELDESATLVAMPHMDTNDDEAFDYNGSDTDAPYTESGVPVTDSAEITVGDTGTETATPTATATPEETETVTPTATPTPEDDTGGDTPTATTEGEGPGFTAVLALVALVAAALLAVRRDD
ncbi:DUF7282 domain-containing protein [Halomicrobium urmianum]|uniref:DUF7282 domain-containing protein n=1 Tax=Halomicrobium urmianum TaxID=1586233 RepID=UPI001CD97379|nr:BGTF surface domain-containing protein [Halomicrobium urmianum]